MVGRGVWWGGVYGGEGGMGGVGGEERVGNYLYRKREWETTYTGRESGKLLIVVCILYCDHLAAIFIIIRTRTHCSIICNLYKLYECVKCLNCSLTSSAKRMTMLGLSSAVLAFPPLLQQQQHRVATTKHATALTLDLVAIIYFFVHVRYESCD